MYIYIYIAILSFCKITPWNGIIVQIVNTKFKYEAMVFQRAYNLKLTIVQKYIFKFMVNNIKLKLEEIMK